jgi:hypothetical protein
VELVAYLEAAYLEQSEQLAYQEHLASVAVAVEVTMFIQQAAAQAVAERALISNKAQLGLAQLTQARAVAVGHVLTFRVATVAQESAL